MWDTYSQQNKVYNPDRPIINAFVLLICVACWGCGYYFSIGFPMKEDAMATPLWNLICRSMADRRLAFGIGFGIMLLGGLLLHRMNYASVLIREKTWLPFLIYLYFISSCLMFMPFMASSIATFCMIVSIYLLFSSYHEEKSAVKAYNWSLMLGIGSLLWSHILLYFPYFWFGMYRMRSLTPKTFFASVFGVLTVYWFLLGWCVWQGDYTLFTQSFSTLVSINLLKIEGAYGWINIVPVIMVAGVTIFASLRILFHSHEEKLRTRSCLDFLIWLPVLTAIFAMFYNQSAEEFLQTACVPASVLMAHYFTVKPTRITYLVFLLTITLCTGYLFFRLWSFL